MSRWAAQRALACWWQSMHAPFRSQGGRAALSVARVRAFNETKISHHINHNTRTNTQKTGLHIITCVCVCVGSQHKHVKHVPNKYMRPCHECCLAFCFASHTQTVRKRLGHMSVQTTHTHARSRGRLTRLVGARGCWTRMHELIINSV